MNNLYSIIKKLEVSREKRHSSDLGKKKHHVVDQTNTDGQKTLEEHVFVSTEMQTDVSVESLDSTLRNKTEQYLYLD